MTFVVEPARSRVCAGRCGTRPESSAEARTRPVDCARMRKGPHGGMLIGKEPRDELEWVRLKRQLVVDKERLPGCGKNTWGRSLGILAARRPAAPWTATTRHGLWPSRRNAAAVASFTTATRHGAFAAKPPS